MSRNSNDLEPAKTTSNPASLALPAPLPQQSALASSSSNMVAGQKRSSSPPKDPIPTQRRRSVMMETAPSLDNQECQQQPQSQSQEQSPISTGQTPEGDVDCKAPNVREIKCRTALCLYTKFNDSKRASAIFALCCNMMSMYNMSPEEAFKAFTDVEPKTTPYRDVWGRSQPSLKEIIARKFISGIATDDNTLPTTTPSPDSESKNSSATDGKTEDSANASATVALSSPSDSRSDASASKEDNDVDTSKNSNSASLPCTRIPPCRFDLRRRYLSVIETGTDVLLVCEEAIGDARQRDVFSDDLSDISDDYDSLHGDESRRVGGDDWILADYATRERVGSPAELTGGKRAEDSKQFKVQRSMGV
ncbi:hypothetical protein BC939DRAFT_532796 [Gamsiella multidivaricata]|uniref:uncharacterized protein n=1 Tax=Gamsiella multidivaricata TaxID=101098 RepID=UPI00221FB77D|nr:uncharacterized protein BC939DRAFT_532796 [Gamsiella multidivaricata]KAI7817397.1 hypothetical protein BC939DRAFT_532796 [Gamsiella multidivaricata]